MYILMAVHTTCKCNTFILGSNFYKGTKNNHYKTMVKHLLPTQVENIDYSNLVSVFALLIKWDRDANRSL